VVAAVAMAFVSVVLEPELNSSIETIAAYATGLGGNAVIGIYAVYGFFFGDDDGDSGVFSAKNGRAILATGAAMYIAAGVLFLMLYNKCNAATAYTRGGDCPLREEFSYNSLLLLLQTVGTLLYLFGLVRPGKEEEHGENRNTTVVSLRGPNESSHSLFFSACSNARLVLGIMRSCQTIVSSAMTYRACARDVQSRTFTTTATYDHRSN
jgi:hypothetical protein